MNLYEGGLCMKKLALLMLLCLVFVIGIPITASALEVSATSAILTDSATGKVLYEQNSNKQVTPGANTQVLTALIALEKGDLERIITIPNGFVSANVGDQGINLAVGEKVVLRDMLYALLMTSANDAAQAVAIGVAGSEEAFVEMMNIRSQELGLSTSTWKNVHGLYEQGHASTAADLAIITREALKHPLFNEIIATKEYEIPWEGNDVKRSLKNHNQFLANYKNADGVKTGASEKGGSSMIGSASSKGLRLIGVVLNADGMYSQMASLMDHGFNSYAASLIGKKDQSLGEITVKNSKVKKIDVVLSEDAYIIANKGAKVEASYVLEVPESLKAPVVKGDLIGTATYTDSNGNVITVDVAAGTDAEKYTLFSVIGSAWQRIFSVMIAK
jgi:D-alanyl-D-alanine carboxypeptidase (penicillin-binding protein 5/6)